MTQPAAPQHPPLDRAETDPLSPAAALAVVRDRLRLKPSDPELARAYRVLSLWTAAQSAPTLGGLESDADRLEASVNAVRRRLGLQARRRQAASRHPPGRE